MAETKTKNKRAGNTPKTHGNKLDNQREVTVYKRKRFELVEVDKEKIDNIKNAVDGSKDNINKGVITSDIILGLSTTLLGSFLGFIPSIADMIKQNKITVDILFYVSLLFVAIILFVVYLNSKRKKCADITALIGLISQNIDSISDSLIMPDNDIPENTPSNNLSETSKHTNDPSLSGGKNDL